MPAAKARLALAPGGHAKPVERASPIAFATRSAERAGVEVLVNFGIFAGREATPAELDDLAHALLREVGAVTIVSEQRHEVSEASEAAVHQVRVAVDPGGVPDRPPEELEWHVIRTAEEWARACVADRPSELSEL